MTVEQILQALGGYTFVANETGIPLTTVHSWKRVGFVPHWRVPAILALAERVGASIIETDIPVRRAASQDAAA